MGNNIDVRGVAIGMLAGLVVGLAVGLLYAPQSGKETRKQIGEKVVGFKEKVGDVTGSIKNQFTHGRETETI